MRDIPKSRWPRLSPLLDELLDLDEPARRQRLAALRAEDAELADDLLALLERDASPAGQAFLDAPALPTLTAAVLVAGQNVGAYTLEREIGHGGMGSVWLARRTDGRFEGQVAIKFLTAGLLGHGDAGRFAREGQILGRLAHPHIARLIDAGVAPEGRQPYLVLEYIDGLPIDAFCTQAQLDVRGRVRLFVDVLAAVAHAHNRLILHRDLKPSNILVTAAGEVKLLDFGIAKLLGDASQAQTGAAATELTQRAGNAYTPQYAAPEQVQGGDVTTATDVDALGVLLYQLLGGPHPTAQANASSLERLRAVVETEARRLSDVVPGKQGRELRGDLDTIVARTLKKAPAERYANAAALAEDLRRWLDHEPIAARPDSAAYLLSKFVRRHRLGVAAGGLIVLALGTGVGVALWEARETERQRNQAEGLIEFMLGDLRKKLEPVGRLEVLDSVGEKALAYYAQQDLARSDADSLGRRARALHLMGEIAEKRGRMGEAEQRFTEAAASTAELLARDPENSQRLFDHAQSSYWVAYAAWQQGKLGAAEAGFQQYLALANRLLQQSPDHPEWLTEQAYAQQNLGVLKLRSGDVAAAQPYFEAANQIWKQLLPQRPALRAELRTTLGWLAEAQARRGLFDAGIASLQSQIEALQPPGAQPGRDRNAQRQLADIASAMGRLHLQAGRQDVALAKVRQAHEAYTALVAIDPDNLDMLERLSFVRQQLAETLLARGDTGEARAELALLQLDLERLLRSEARKPAWSGPLRGRWLTGRLLSATAAERPAAMAALSDFLAQMQAGNGTAAADPDTLDMLAGASLALGDALPDQAAAARQWVQALQWLASLQQAPGLRVECLRAMALARLGRTQEARVLADKLEASAFRHPMYADLRRLLP